MSRKLLAQLEELKATRSTDDRLFADDWNACVKELDVAIANGDDGAIAVAVEDFNAMLAIWNDPTVTPLMRAMLELEREAANCPSGRPEGDRRLTRRASCSGQKP